MTNPYARPDQPEGQVPSTAPQDETIPLVPESGYGQASPWSQAYEQTAVDPLDRTRPASGYTNPTPGSPGYPQPEDAQDGYPQPQPANPAAGYRSPAYPSAPSVPLYEQPPMAAGYSPYGLGQEPTSAALVPSYSGPYPGGYPVTRALPDHPNAVPTLVLAILGFFVGLTFPVAWYLGAKGSADIKRQPGRWRSSPMMTVGMVIGIIGTILMVLVVGLVVLGITAFVMAA